MGLVAHLRKETELCVRVVDLYLFVCVCRSRDRYRSPQALPGTCFGIPGATVMASAGGMWKAIAGGQNHHADIDAHAHTCPCIWDSNLVDTNCHNKNIWFHWPIWFQNDLTWCFLHCFSLRDANPLRVFSPLPQPPYHPQGGRIGTILHYSILYFTILYYTVLYYIILCYAILYYITLCYTIPYYASLYHTILYYTMLYYNIS